MSNKIMGMVYDLDLSHSQQNVLLAMADHADHDGRNVRPSIALIAWKVGYSDRQVSRVIQSLVNSGILVVERSPEGKPREYKIEISAGKLKPTRNRKTDPRHSYVTTSRHSCAMGGSDIAMSGSSDIAMSESSDIAMSYKSSRTINEPQEGDEASPCVLSESTTTSSYGNPITTQEDTVTTTEERIAKADTVMLAWASRSRSEKAIVRANASELAKGLAAHFYEQTKIEYTKGWMSACEEMSGVGVSSVDIDKALAEAKTKGWAVNDPHSILKTAVRIASNRKTQPDLSRQTGNDGEVILGYRRNAEGQMVMIVGVHEPAAQGASRE